MLVVAVAVVDDIAVVVAAVVEVEVVAVATDTAVADVIVVALVIYESDHNDFVHRRRYRSRSRLGPDPEQRGAELRTLLPEVRLEIRNHVPQLVPPGQ